MQGFFADDATLADVGAADFELRFDEDDHLALGGEQGGEAIEHERDTDEANVADEKTCGFADDGGLNQAGVLVLMQNDARVCLELPIDLGCSNVDAMDAGGTVLEKAVGEAAGGGADVDGDAAGGVNLELLESPFEFEAAAADVAKLFEEFDGCVSGDGRAGLVDLLSIHQNLTGEDEGFAAFSRRDEAALD